MTLAGTRFTVEKVERTSGDPVLLGLIMLLAGLGISMLFSSSYYYAERLFGDAQYFLRRQIVWILLGAAAAFIVYHLPLKLIRRAAVPLVLSAVTLSILAFVPGIGTEVMGARRWIIIFGHSFQPSELVKLTLVLYLAHMLDKRETEGQVEVNDLVNSLLPLLIVIAVLIVPVYLQNDFSTTMFLLTLAAAVLFLGKVKILYFSLAGLVTLPLSIILLFTREHRVKRLIAFIDPLSDPAGSGYQVIASQDALARGGLWGAGLGKSVKKLGGLPEAHSDFVFAVLGEEAGFFGVLFVLALFTALGIRGFRIASRCEDRFSYYLACGITISIVMQAFLNMAVVCGLVPATGIPLPFFSSGGSSIFITLIMCGVLLNISKNSLGEKEADNV